MSYYFNESLKLKIKEIVPEISDAPEARPAAASIAKSILDMMAPSDIKIRGDKIRIGPSTTIGANEYYDSKALARVEQDLKQAFKDEFGVNAEVTFVYGGATKDGTVEGGSGKIHLYKLSMAVPL